MSAVPTPASVVDPAGSVPANEPPLPVKLPRVAIQFCTQCKWMLRAAYYAQELLSTFGSALGEVALQPATGGVFKVTILAGGDPETEAQARTKLLWDRAVDGGFPETKELKRRVRDVIAPGRDLGHVDRGKTKAATAAGAGSDDPTAAAASTATTPAPAPASASAAGKPSVATAATEGETAVPVCEDCQ